jgi:hypothetical protein
MHVGQHEHRRRMLEQAVRHLVQRQTHVFQAQFLAGDIERHVRKPAVHRAHHPRQHGAVADAGVEHPQRRRPRMDAGKLQPDAVGDHPLLRASMHEQQVFLPVLEEAKIAARVAALDRRLQPRRRRHALRQRLGDEGLDAIQRVDGDALALAQPVQVDSAISNCRQKSEIRSRIWSFFMGLVDSGKIQAGATITPQD